MEPNNQLFKVKSEKSFHNLNNYLWYITNFEESSYKLI